MTRAREAARLIGNNTFRLDSNNAVGFNSTTPDAMFDINHGLTVAGVSTFTGNVTMEGDLTVQGTTTTLDTNLQEVDLINVQANASVPAIGVTQSGSGNIISAYDGTSEVFSIADGGNVGVSDKIIHLGDTNTAIRFPSADTFTVETGGSERLRVDSEGKTTIQGSGASNNPFEIFTLKNTETSSSAQSIQINLETNRNSQQGISTIKSIANDNSGTAILELSSSQYRIKNQAGTSTYATIDSSGRLLVGTTTSKKDSAKLQIVGSDNTNHIELLNTTASDTNGQRYSYVWFRGTQSGGEESSLAFIGAVHDGSSDDEKGRLIFHTNDGNDGDSPTERVRIDSSGRVLVGTDTGQGNSLLQVEGDSSSGAAQGSLSLRRGLNTASIGGNVGADLGKITFGGNDGTVAATIQSQSDATWSSTSDCPGNIQFLTTADGASSPTEHFRIDSAGQLLASNYKSNGVLTLGYDANGNNAANDYINFVLGASDEKMRLDGTGRLLIGATSSIETNSQLQVVGSNVNGSIIIARNDTSVANNQIVGRIQYYGNDSNGTYQLCAAIDATADGDHATGDKPTRLVFSTTADGASSPTEKFRIDSRGSFQFSNGFMNETVNINSTARNGTQAVNLDDGMVHYFSTNSSGTWKPNFTMSSGNDINATIATGDVFSPTMIVAKGATTHYATTIQVDGSDVTPEFSGGAPSDGGGSGTFDVYNYTIIKTGDDTFKAFAAVSTYE